MHEMEIHTLDSGECEETLPPDSEPVFEGGQFELPHYYLYLHLFSSRQVPPHTPAPSHQTHTDSLENETKTQCGWYQNKHHVFVDVWYMHFEGSGIKSLVRLRTLNWRAANKAHTSKGTMCTEASSIHSLATLKHSQTTYAEQTQNKSKQLFVHK